MKPNRLIKIFICLFAFMCFTINSKAVETKTLYTKSSLSINDSKQISLKIYVKTDDIISGALIPWSFDTSKLKLVSLTSKNFSVTYKDQQDKITKNIVLDSAKDFSGEVELFEIKFELTSGFKDTNSTLINFNPGQIASYKTSYKTAGASFEVSRGTNNTINLDYEVIPIPVTLENTTNNSKTTKLDTGSESSNSGSESSKNSNIGAIDTGVAIPSLTIAVFGCGFVGFKKKKNILFKI